MSQEVLSNINEVFGSVGQDAPVQDIQATGGFDYYQHEAGIKTRAILGKVKWYYKDAEGKTKDKDGVAYTKDSPGVTLADYCMLPMYIIGKGEDDSFESLFNQDGTPKAGVKSEQISYMHYVTLVGERQFTNKIFASLVYPAFPDEAVVLNPTARDFKFRVSKLSLFEGCPVNLLFEVNAKKTDKTYLKSIEMIDTTIDKDKFAKRQEKLPKLMAAVEALRDAEKAERDAKKDGGNTDTAANAAMPF